MPALIITVRFHDGRYHGRPDWPPSPARLFQALVAGAARGGALADLDAQALAWLEAVQEPPVIAAPHYRYGQGFSNYVPNNDLDAVGGDPKRVDKIRAPKLIGPILFSTHTPFLYVWRIDGVDAHAQRICDLAERVYQVGRGVDMAWATGEIIDAAEADKRLAEHEGPVHTPSCGSDGVALAAPTGGSLASLIRRHAHRRFETVQSNRKRAQLFRQPPKPLFRQVTYDSPPARLLFDLIGAQSPIALKDIAAFTDRLRDAAAAKLSDKLESKHGDIDRCLVGRGADEADKVRRVRIVPLPSIGHQYVSPAIRRVMVEIPATCPLRADDVAWAFSELEVAAAEIDHETGEVKEQLVLTMAADRGMLPHYGVEDALPARLWRTVTPAALTAVRRRIDPERLRSAQSREREVKAGREREQEERSAAAAALQALRHAGVRGSVESVRVQREPWTAKGTRAEAFAHGRFNKHRLWHIEIAFTEHQAGPLIIGDGRYLGLGLMAPQEEPDGVLSFDIRDGLANGAASETLPRALRRAIMARVQQEMGLRVPLPQYFSGHAEGGAPARTGHCHLTFVYDDQGSRLLIIPPHVLDRRHPFKDERRHLATLSRAARALIELRAGASGRLRLAPAPINMRTDPLFAGTRVWESATTFRVTRHAKCGDAAAAIETNIRDELCRAGLPIAQIEVLKVTARSGAGLGGRARLTFAAAVAGPVILGRDRHFGGGLFRACATR